MVLTVEMRYMVCLSYIPQVGHRYTYSVTYQTLAMPPATQDTTHTSLIFAEQSYVVQIVCNIYIYITQVSIVFICTVSPWSTVPVP